MAMFVHLTSAANVPQIRLDDEQRVLVGRYTDRAREAQCAVPAAEAVRRIAALDDARGWEVLVPSASGR